MCVHGDAPVATITDIGNGSEAGDHWMTEEGRTSSEEKQHSSSIRKSQVQQALTHKRPVTTAHTAHLSSRRASMMSQQHKEGNQKKQVRKQQLEKQQPIIECVQGNNTSQQLKKKQAQGQEPLHTTT